MISELGFDAPPAEITRFLIATNGFIAFMRTREAAYRTAKAQSRKSDVFEGQCPLRPATVESMISDGLLGFVGVESMTVVGVLEYYEPTEKAKAQ